MHSSSNKDKARYQRAGTRRKSSSEWLDIKVWRTQLTTLADSPPKRLLAAYPAFDRTGPDGDATCTAIPLAQHKDGDVRVSQDVQRLTAHEQSRQTASPM